MKLGELRTRLASSRDTLLLSLERYYSAQAESVRHVCAAGKKRLKSEINVNICKHIRSGQPEDLSLDDVRKLPDLVERHFPESLKREALNELCVRFLTGYLDLALKSAELGVFDRHLYLFGMMDENNPFDDSEDAARASALKALSSFFKVHGERIVGFFTCDDPEMTKHGQKPNTMLAVLKEFLDRLGTLNAAATDPLGKLPAKEEGLAREAEKRFAETLIHAIIAYKFFADEAEETVFDIFGEERVAYFTSWENFYTEYLQKAVEAAYERIIKERLYVPDSYERSGIHHFRIAFHMGHLKHVVTPLATAETPMFRATIRHHARIFEDENEAVKGWLVNHGKRKLDPFRTSENEFRNLIRVMKIYPEAEELANLSRQPEARRKSGGLRLLNKVLGRADEAEEEARAMERLDRSLASIAHAVDDVLYYYSDRLVMGAIKNVFSFTIVQGGEKVRISRVAKRVERTREKSMLDPAFYKWMFHRIVHMVFYDIIRNIKGSNPHEFIEGLKDSASVFDKDILVIINVTGMVRDFKARLEKPGAKFSPPERAELEAGGDRKQALIALSVYESILNYTIPDWVGTLRGKGVKGFLSVLAQGKGGGRSRLFDEMLNLKLAEMLDMNPCKKDSAQLNFHLIQEALKVKLRLLEAGPDKESGKEPGGEPDGEPEKTVFPGEEELEGEAEC